MIDLAEHILRIAYEQETRVRTINIQKIMYFTIGEYIHMYDIDGFIKNVYQSPFEGRAYGPIIPEVYSRYRKYGRMTIHEKGVYYDRLERLNECILPHLRRDDFEMIYDSLERKSWIKNKDEVLNGYGRFIYTLEDIKENFKV